MGEFTHLDEKGLPAMVDVGKKDITQRMATARALIYLPEEVFRHFENDDIQTKKGSVFQTAIIAGIMGAKKTSDLIPLCHPLAIDNCRYAGGKPGLRRFSLVSRSGAVRAILPGRGAESRRGAP